MELTKIYLVTNCYGDPNKVYIGKTKICRKKAHKKTYGNNITYDYIDEVNSLDRKDWKPLETFWIQYFLMLGFEMQNIKMIGGGGVEYHTENTRFKIGNKHKGLKKPFSEEHKLNHKNSYTNRIVNWGSSISKGLQGRNIDWGDKISKSKIGKQCKTNPIRNNKSIIQYNLDGNFIKEWPSISQANKELKCDVGGYLRGRYKHAGGYKWGYKN